MTICDEDQTQNRLVKFCSAACSYAHMQPYNSANNKVTHNI